MKKIVLCILVLFLITAITSAQSHGTGVGIIAGNPTGISLKSYLSDGNALQGAVAWNFENSGNFSAQLDYVVEFSRLSVESGRLPVYAGIGGYLVLANKTKLGVRFPIGLNYQFAKAPFDIFIELVPALELVTSTKFVINAGIGARYWF